MYEIDFLPVNSAGGPGGKSGDAITARFTTPGGATAVIVVDAGFTETGARLAQHVRDYYNTERVDLVISTHPDIDHLNGLAAVLEELDVDELLVAQPWNHHPDVARFSNLEAIRDLVKVAAARRTRIREPFTGLSACSGAITVLGPTRDYYAQCVRQHLDEEASGTSARLASAASAWATTQADVWNRGLVDLPEETLGEDGDSGPRNNSSVITALSVDDRRILLTGDAGIDPLWSAANVYEQQFGSFATYPLTLFQAPHHGSRRNLSPSLLDRIIGPRGAPHGETEAAISAADADPKHPSPKVTNALLRRGVESTVTGTRSVCWRSPDALPRPGWGPGTPVPAMAEDD